MPEQSEASDAHPVHRAFAAAGYPESARTDPAHVTADDIREGGWRVVAYTSHGILSFGVGDEVFEVDRPSYIVYGVESNLRGGATHPIGFADESGPLNDSLPSRKEVRANPGTHVVYFVGPDAERQFPSFEKREAIEVMGLWGSEGYFPFETARNICAAFGVELDESVAFEDDDTEGERLVRAHLIPGKVANAVFGSSKEADGDITGHKKRRRQRFYRNLDALCEHFGVSRL